jgi:hypothetical protein
MYGYVQESALVQRMAQLLGGIQLKERGLHQEEVFYRSGQSVVHRS